MKKIFSISIILALVLLFPLTVYAEWVDADRGGLENVLVYNYSHEFTYNNYYTSQLAIDSQGRPHLAFIEWTTGYISKSIHYLYWNGTEWVDADGEGTSDSLVVDCGGSTNNCKFSLALDSNDRPGLALVYGGLLTATLNYLYHNGTAWVDADGTGQGGMKVYTSVVLDSSLDFNSNDEPTIAFSLFGAGSPLYYLRWDSSGGAWVDADGTGQGEIQVHSGNSDTPFLVLDSSNQPTIAWENTTNNDIYYLKWNGTSWVDADGTGQGGINVSNTGGASNPSLALNNANQPRIAWKDSSPGNDDIYYLQWSGAAWTDVDGSGKEGINVSSDPGTSGTPSLALDPDNNYYPALAWSDNTTIFFDYALYCLKWNGSSWVDADGENQDNISVYESTDAAACTSRSLTFGSGAHITWMSFASDQWRENIRGVYYLEWLEPSSPTSSPASLPQTGADLVSSGESIVWNWISHLNYSKY